MIVLTVTLSEQQQQLQFDILFQLTSTSVEVVLMLAEFVNLCWLHLKVAVALQ